MKFFMPDNAENIIPCGMFTIQHILALLVCLFIIGISLYYCRYISMEKLRHIVFYMAVIFTILEIVKIIYKFTICHYDPIKQLDQWLPLYFCSLFIFALWMALAKNEHVRNLGESFLSIGCFTGGFAYLFFPTTSLACMPLFHFLSFHSLAFHSSMVFIGLMYIYKNRFVPSKQSYLSFFLVLSIFMIPALFINSFGYNTMMLSDPFNFPIEAISKFFKKYSYFYTIIVVIGYTFGPFIVSTGLYHLINKLKKHLNLGEIIELVEKNT